MGNWAKNGVLENNLKIFLEKCCGFQDWVYIYITIQTNNDMTLPGVTVTNITNEAKSILMPAMKGFCKPARVKSEMELWIEDRTMEIRINEGIDEAPAKAQATREYEAR